MYFQLSFGQLHKGNPEIKKLATLFGRTPSSVAMKLANFASLDPKITETGRKGLDGATKLDRQVWKAFQDGWTKEVTVAETQWNESDSLTGTGKVKEAHSPFAFQAYQGLSSVEATIERRVGQGFFRRAVLANFDGRCCVTGIAVEPLLNASHIVPWNIDVQNRHNPANGLAMSATFDRAFDRGLIAFNEQKQLLISCLLTAHNDRRTRDTFLPYNHCQMASAQRFEPASAFLFWHRENVFLDGIS